MFWPFHVIRDYGHTLREVGSRHVPKLPDLIRRAERLEAAVGPIDVVFGHNDLLAANILDDGKKLWLLDWEYAGFNSPLFDLGGLASNSEMPADMAEALVSAYFGRPVDDDLRRKAAAMTAASLLRETLWAMVSEVHSTVDFDYAAYTAENLARFEAAYTRYESMERT
jgi:thiamine kinase-like enzyme